MRLWAGSNLPTSRIQLVRCAAGLSQSGENAALVYALQKALAQRAKSTFLLPNRAARIAFSLAFTIAESIRESGKATMELRAIS